jgi:predicted lipid-binding transport protein (Tim44 family)
MRGDTLRVAGVTPSARPAAATRRPAPETSLPARLGSLALGGAALWGIVALGGPSAYIPLAISAAIVVAVSLALRHGVPRLEQRVSQALAGDATTR